MKNRGRKIYCEKGKILQYLDKQLSVFWDGLYEIEKIEQIMGIVLKRLEKNFSDILLERYWDENGKFIISVTDTSLWSILLYMISNELYHVGFIDEASVVYYLNKVLHSVEWFYAVDLPECFMVEHPIGSVLGKAKYGDELLVYQGVTVGGSKKRGNMCYPSIGKRVTLFANSTVLGDSVIGNNVIVSAETYIINEKIPNNCIVFGKSPNLVIVKKEERIIKDYTAHVWREKENENL